jgi:hypothetical protein
MEQQMLVSQHMISRSSISSMIDVLERTTSENGNKTTALGKGQILDSLSESLRSKEMAGVWRIHDTLYSSTKEHEVNAICYKGIALMANMAAWQWMTTVFDEEFKRFTAVPRRRGWLTRLFHKATTYFDNPTESMVLSAHDCIEGFTDRRLTFVIKASGRRKNFARTPDGYRDLLEPVLVKWLGFPSTGYLVTKARAAVCSAVTDSLGYWAVFLPNVWDVCMNIASIAGESSGKLSVKKMEKWFANFATIFEKEADEATQISVNLLGDLLREATGRQIGHRRLRSLAEAAYAHRAHEAEGQCPTAVSIACC